MCATIVSRVTATNVACWRCTRASRAQVDSFKAAVTAAMKRAGVSAI